MKWIRKIWEWITGLFKVKTAYASDMPTYLEPNEYDASYFDGNSQPLRHNAGYSRYERWHRHENVRGRGNSSGEFWGDIAEAWKEELELDGKKVLIIGCAKGFLVKNLRDLGVDAHGLDCSSYAIGEAEAGMSEFLTVGDAKTYLSNYRQNEWDWIITRRLIEVLDIADVDSLISDMNRVSKNQFHTIEEEPPADFCTQMSLDDWLLKGWRAGTKLEALRGGRQLTK